MRPFELLYPESLEEAYALLTAGNGETKLIAGGTALVILMKQGVYFPDRLVSLRRVRGWDDIAFDAESGLRLGARARLRDVEQSRLVRQHYPLLAQAVREVATVRIRNAATVGGNLAHADHQSDPPAALIALDARVRLTSTRGDRTMPLQDFLISSYTTAIDPGEVLSEVLVPPPVPGSVGLYRRLTFRTLDDRPCATVAVQASLDAAGRCQHLRLVLGAVAGCPVRLVEAESLARGEPLAESLIGELAARARAAFEPVADRLAPPWYRRQVAGVLVERALQEIARSAAEGARP